MGAVAAIIADNGRCKEYDQRCIPGANQHLGEGFSAQDVPTPWQAVKIPLFFVLQDIAQGLMSIQSATAVNVQEPREEL